MSEHWSPNSDLENDPVRDLAGMDFTQQEPHASNPTQTPNFDPPAYYHSGLPSMADAMPVEIARQREEEADARARESPEAWMQYQAQQARNNTQFHTASAPSSNLNPQSPTPSPSRTRGAPVRRNEDTPRFSPYPLANPGSQTASRTRSATPASQGGPIHLSPSRQRGATRLPSTMPTTTYPDPQFNPSQPPSSRPATGMISQTGIDYTSGYPSQTPIPSNQYPIPQLQQSASGGSLVHQSPGQPAQIVQPAITQQTSGPSQQHHLNARSLPPAHRAQLQRMADKLFRDGLAKYAEHHNIQHQNIPPEVVAQYKSQAQAMALQMIFQHTRQRGTISLQQPQHTQQSSTIAPPMQPPTRPQPSQLPDHSPTLDGQNSPKPTLHSPHKPGPENPTSEHRVSDDNGEHGSTLKDNEDGSTQSQSHRVKAGTPNSADASTTNQTTSAPNQADRRQLLKNQVNRAIATANNAYVNRAASFAEFQRYYPQMKQNVLQAIWEFLAGPTGLGLLGKEIWTADHEQLLRLTQAVSAALNRLLPVVQKIVRGLVAEVVDQELKWTLVSRALEMVYNTFGSLKAALQTRDQERGDGQQSLVDALNISRAQVWTVLTPSSDDELEAAISQELAARPEPEVEEDSTGTEHDAENWVDDQVQEPSEVIQDDGA